MGFEIFVGCIGVGVFFACYGIVKLEKKLDANAAKLKEIEDRMIHVKNLVSSSESA